MATFLKELKRRNVFRVGIAYIIVALFVLLAFVLLAPRPVLSAPGESADMFSAYRGLYRIAPDHAVGVSAFINDSGKPVMLFSDYRSGIVRRIFPVSDDEFVMGPKFDAGLPSTLNVRFIKNKKGL